MRSFVILLTLCTVVGAAEPVAPTKEDLAKLPSWGVVTTASETTNDVAVGDSFVGRAMVGRVSFKNDTEHPIKIGEVKSSCSCTAGKLDKDSVAPGEEATLLLRILKLDAGGFEEGVSVLFGARHFRVVIRGKCQPGLKFSDAVFDKDGKGTLSIDVIDPKYVAKQVRFKVLTRSCKIVSGKIKDRRITLGLEHSKTAGPASQLAVSPRYREDTLETETVAAIHHGLLRVTPPIVSVRKSQNKVKLFLMGDLADVKQNDVPVPVTVGDKTVNVVFQYQVEDSYVGLTADNFFKQQTVGTHRVKMSITDIPISFLVRVR